MPGLKSRVLAAEAVGSTLRVLVAVLALAALPAQAAPGTEFVLVLDDSSSLVAGSTLQTEQPDGRVVETKLPATDPDRLSVLATLLLNGLLEPQDRLTIVTFKHPKDGPFSTLKAEKNAIREMRQEQGTWFSGPLAEARRILTTSDKVRRVLVFMTDGAPSPEDPMDGKKAKEVLGLDQGPAPFDIIAIGLSTGDAYIEKTQKDILGAMGEFVPVRNPADLIGEFTKAYARTLRSRPQSGTLQPGASFAFDVPTYVSEVLVTVAGQTRSGPFTSRLETDRGRADAKESGDNGCRYCKPAGKVVHCTVPDQPNNYRIVENARLCQAPFNHYAIYKEPHDPERASRWTLNLTEARGPAAYGIILRYDLAAEVMEAPTSVHVGEEVTVRARLTFKTKTFDDRKFFEADGFKATAVLGDQEAPFVLQADSTFTAKVVANKEGKIPLSVRFENRWIDLRASAPDVLVEGWIPLSFNINPAVLDFGAWTGADGESRRCLQVDLTGSKGIDQVPFELVADGFPAEVQLATPEGGTPGPVLEGKPNGNKLQVCLSVPGCCSAAELAPGGPAKILFRGKHPHYHPEAVPAQVKASIGQTPFIVCWWRVIAGIVGLILAGIVVYGYASPFEFDREEVIRMAKNEQAIARAVARRLVELPGGRKGFYRHARCGFDGTGNAVTDIKGAVVALVARKGDPVLQVRGTLEKKDPRTRQWVAVPQPDVADALRRGNIYRVGDFYFKIG